MDADTPFREQLVQIANGLLSDIPYKQNEAIQSLFKIKHDQGSQCTVLYARVLQELAAYQNGAVICSCLQKMRQVLEMVEMRPGMQITWLSSWGTSNSQYLVWTAASKALAQSILKQGNDTWNMLLEFFNTQLCKLYAGYASHPAAGAFLLQEPVLAQFRIGLEGILAFSRVSLPFRTALKQLDILSTIEHIISPELLRKVKPDIAADQLATMAAELMYCFSEHGDTCLWAAQGNMLSITAATLNHSQSGPRATRGTIARIVGMALGYTLRSSTACKELREKGAYKVLEPYKQCLDEINPCAYQAVKSLSINPAEFDARMPQTPVAKEVRRQWISVSCTVPSICSWEHCLVGQEPEGRKFGACGRCGVALYCSKEHQRLHWSVHKVSCKKGAKTT